jgi:DNA end-binding protein Ku
MAATIWKGAISFGLVSIPVGLRSAVQDVRPQFRMLHAKDEAPIHFDRVCQKEGASVPWKEIVKGYEYQKGRYVILTQEDLDKAAMEKSNTIDILAFIERDALDVRYFETPYYLVPDKAGEKAYAVLRETIREAGKVGIAKIILREKQHLAALSVVDQALVLTFIRYADEVRDAGAVSFPSKQLVQPKEVRLAQTLVDQLTEEWDPKRYKDDYRENLMRVIRAKLTGEKPKLKNLEVEHDRGVIDLMSRLRESLHATGAKRGARQSGGRSSKGRLRRAAS